MFSKGRSKKFDSKDKEIAAALSKDSKTSNTTTTTTVATATTAASTSTATTAQNKAVVAAATTSPPASPASSSKTQKKEKKGSRKGSSTKTTTKTSSSSSSSSKKPSSMDKVETTSTPQTEPAAASSTSAASGVANKFVAGTATTPGKNRYNEDRAVIIPNLGGRSTHAYFAVYDGHGGTKCSVFCTKFLADLISKEPNFETDVNSAIVNGFVKADKRFLKKQESCGSTVNVAIVTESKVIVANAGDCRCVASVGKKAKPFSQDHKPSDPIERERIEKAHHEVTTETILVKGKRIKMCRIDGMISVSRGIGDPDFKDEYDLPPEEQAISCIPDITEYPINSDLRFFVIACDGLWDVMSNEEVVDFIEERLKGASEATEELANSICEQLVNDAVSNYGSSDNVTAVLVLFKRS